MMQADISQWDGQAAMPADQKTANEGWIDAVKIAERKGYKQRYRLARNPSDVAKMRDQNRAISQISFGMPPGYERIRWQKKGA